MTDMVIALLQLLENIGAMAAILLLFLHWFPLAIYRTTTRINFPGLLLFSLLALIAAIPLLAKESFGANLSMVAILLTAVHVGLIEAALVGLTTTAIFLAIGSVDWVPWAMGSPFCGLITACMLKRFGNRLTCRKLGQAALFACLCSLAYVYLSFPAVNGGTVLNSWGYIFLLIIIGHIAGTILLHRLIIYLQSHQSFTELLAEAEVKYRSLVESSLTGIYVIQGSKLVYVSQGFTAITGYSRAQLLAITNVYDYIHPDDRASVHKIIHQKLTNQTAPVTYELRLLSQTGGLRYVKVQSSYFEIGGKPAIIGTMTDINECKQAEQALCESQELFRYLANDIPFMVWMEDRESRCVFVNKQWQEYTGLTWEEGSDISWDCRLHPQEKKPDKSLNREKFDYECRMLRHDGEYRWVQLIGIPRQTPDGSFAGYIGCCLDIHDSKEADKALQRSYRRLEKNIEEQTRQLANANATLAQEIFTRRAVEKRYRQLFDSVQDSIFVWKITPQGLPGRIIEVNDIACRRLGYSRDELLSLSMLDTMSGQGKAAATSHMEKLLTSRQAIFEFDHLTKDQRPIPSEVNAHIFALNEELVGLCISRDISDRKEAEAELSAARNRISRTEKLAFLGNMAAGIAHEINQPLNSIKVTADSILMWYKEGQTYQVEEFLEDVQTISEQSARIANIINYIRDLIRTSQQSTNQRFSLTGAITNAVKMTFSQAGAADISLTLKLAEDPLEMYGSLAHMEHVFLNLISNAIDALTGLEQSVKEIEIETLLHDKIIVQISDNGTGITEELRKRIFTPFFSTKNNGMGLGLAIVKSVVTSHGGQITIMNNERGGATFRLVFPLIEAADNLKEEDAC